MKFVNQSIYAALLFLVSGCTAPYSRTSAKTTPLQVREVQSRTFEESDMKSVMKAMIDVLQDEGYIVRNAVLDLGVVTAEKSIEIEERSQTSLASWIKGGEACVSKFELIEVSANVSDFGNDTKVRLSFQRKTYDGQGGILVVSQVVDPNHYQNFFAKVSKGIFLHSENL